MSLPDVPYFPNLPDLPTVQDGPGMSNVPDFPKFETNLPDEFWQSSHVLMHIRAAAHSRLRSADAVLANVLARTAAMVDPTTTTIDVGLGPASLNTMCAVVGPPSAGKSSAARTARALCPDLPPHLIGVDRHRQPLFKDGVSPSTGEGMVEAYIGRIEVEEVIDGEPEVAIDRGQCRRNVYFALDEGENLTKLIERPGSTIGPILRSMWSGDPVGQENASVERNRHLGDRSYATGLTIGYQPTTARALLSDTAAGTPQRFLWFSATDPVVARYIDGGQPAWPGTLRLEIRREPVTASGAFLDGLRRRAVQATSGLVVVESIDAHLDYVQVKTAGVLAVLMGTYHVDDAMWALAGMVVENSRNVRDSLIRATAEQVAREREARLADVAETATSAKVAELSVATDVKRVAERIGRLVAENGTMTIGEVRRTTTSRDRKYLDLAVDMAASMRTVAVSDDGKILSPM